MTQNDMHTIEAVRLADDRSPLASLLDRLFERIEELERESRRHTQVIGGLVEHEQIREERESGAAMLHRLDRAVHPTFASTLAHFSPLVPSEPRG